MSKIVQTTVNSNGQDQNPTLRDVINAVNTSSTVITVELQGVKEDITGMKRDISGLKQDVSGLKQDVSGLKQDVRQIKATMVTKDYLDEKLHDLRGDLTVLIRKEDKKTVAIVNLLKTKQVFTAEEAQTILQLEPFPQ